MKATVSSLSRKRVEKNQKVIIRKTTGEGVKTTTTTLNKSLSTLI